MTSDDLAHVRDALDHLETLEHYLRQSDFSNPVVADAVAFRLAAAIESLSRTRVEFREAHFGNSWKLMWAVRNRITHAYTAIDVTVITQTIEQDVPALKNLLMQVLERR